MIQKRKYSHVIWDWNGTLFDDVGWCVSVINAILHKRNLKTLDSIVAYQNVFCFPIIKYYQNIGLDLKKESFEAIAAEYIVHYHQNKSGNCSLHDKVEDTLKEIQSKKITQIILSASQIDNLLMQIGEFEISEYFDALLGISDIYANSKIQIGQDYMKNKNITNAVLIGDTLHDYEVAQALHIDCLLIAKGHQSKEILQTSKVPVLDDISSVLDYL